MNLTLKQLHEEVDKLHGLAEALKGAEIKDSHDHPIFEHHALLNLSAIRFEMMALNKSLEVQNQLLLFSIENRIWFPRLRKLFLWIGSKLRRKS